MPLPVIRPTRAEISQCFVRYSSVHGSVHDGNFAKNVLGFVAPHDEKWLTATKSDPLPSIIQAAGFRVYFVECKQGSGCDWHNHDTTETFIILGGTWRVEWEGKEGVDFIVMERYDVFSFPPGVLRRFCNMSHADGRDEGVLLAIVAGDTPVAETLEEELARMRIRMTQSGV